MKSYYIILLVVIFFSITYSAKPSFVPIARPFDSAYGNPGDNIIFEFFINGNGEIVTENVTLAFYAPKSFDISEECNEYGKNCIIENTSEVPNIFIKSFTPVGFDTIQYGNKSLSNVKISITSIGKTRRVKIPENATPGTYKVKTVLTYQDKEGNWYQNIDESEFYVRNWYERNPLFIGFLLPAYIGIFLFILRFKNLHNFFERHGIMPNHLMLVTISILIGIGIFNIFYVQDTLAPMEVSLIILALFSLSICIGFYTHYRYHEAYKEE